MSRPRNDKLRKPTRPQFGEGRRLPVVERPSFGRFRRGNDAGMHVDGNRFGTREALAGGKRESQQTAREGEVWPVRVAERSVVLLKPGNSGGGKGPWFRVSVEEAKARRLV